jgi:hypothetical protein
MKVALCISGQARFVQKCFPAIKSNIIDQADTDVFCHTWLPKEGFEYKFIGQNYQQGWKDFKITDDDINAIQDLYKPVRSIILPVEEMFVDVLTGDSIPKYYGGVAECDRDRYRLKMIKASLGMYKGIWAANHIKEEYRLTNNVKYDYVIRCRYDVIPCRPIKYDSMSDGHILYEELNQPDGMVSDLINIGSNGVMNAYSSIFHNWETLVNMSMRKRNVWCNELLISEMMEIFEIKKTPQYWALQLVRL